MTKLLKKTKSARSSSQKTAKNISIRALAGCLAGDTLIGINRAGKSSKIRLDRLVAQFNNVDYWIQKSNCKTRIKKWDLSIPTTVQCAINGDVRLATLKDAWYSGVKNVFEITTDSNRTIQATDEHPFMVEYSTEQFKSIKDGLKEGDLVCVDSGKSSSGSIKRYYYQQTNVKNHPNKVHRGSGYFSVATHRLVLEASWNELSFPNYLAILNSKEPDLSDLVFMEKSQIVHHIDGNPQNNDLSNLEVMDSPKEHSESHEWTSNVQAKIGYEKVVSIQKVARKVKTYDLELECEPHNFIANGFVVHNTGKTTTLCWSIMGVPDGVTLSSEQEPIVQAIKNLMENFNLPTNRFTAFSKAIATELQSRLPSSVDCCTNHSLGLKTIKANKGWKLKVDNYKTWKICEELFGKVKEIKGAKERKAQQDLYHDVRKIVSITKATLTGNLSESQEASHWVGTASQIEETCNFYSIEVTTKSIEASMEVLKEASRRCNWIDFDDMIWLPAIHNMTVEKADIGIVDEAQDLNASQLWFASHSCQFLVTIGDINQSIFGFAGADPNSIPRIESWMESNGGFDTFPLNETRRCGKAIVSVCSQIVPEFKAHESNAEGELRSIPQSQAITEIIEDSAESNDVMVLCRTNAPLTKLALTLLKSRVPAVIRGRQFAEGIISLIRNLDATNCVELLNALNDYQHEESQKLLSSNRQDADQKLIELKDKCDIVRIFSEGCSTPDCIISKFNELFSDENKANHIILSSAHRAKGLEADKVYILKPELLPHPKIADKSEFNAIQERNLHYVARSRAKYELIDIITPTIESED